MNRRVIGQVANLHFAPTQIAVATLRAEGHDESSIFS
jgi:UDP-N-acetylglucosamine 2-epimerase